MRRVPYTTKPVSYFEHNERKTNTRAVHLDLVEWDPPVVVKEHRSMKDHWNFRKAWLNRIKGNSK